MHVSDFSFDLPDELIARYPTPERTGSRLLHLDGATGVVAHGMFSDVLNFFRAGDLLVVNDTRVIPARLYGQKESGGKIEVLVERVLDDTHILAHVRSSRSPKQGTRLLLEGEVWVTMLERRDSLFVLALDTTTSGESALSVLKRFGHMPLPPYINRPDDTADHERYQTVYGVKEGAVAAPTAGLHFDSALLQAVKTKGVNIATITLHVGAGTFQPVKVDKVTDHHMHSEVIEVTEAVVASVRATRARGGRVVAVGTTSVRALESASSSGEIAAYTGETEIFIYPGYQFRSVDALITNFHLSESTLLMLVSAFAGREATLAAYAQAVTERYRFFSYGDAMLVTPCAT